MDVQSNRVFFALLRSSIGPVRLGEAERESLTPELQSRLIKTAAKHDIAHLLISALGDNGLPMQGEAYANQAIYTAVYRDEQRRFVLEEICAAFEGAKIPFIPLKGAVICSYYPEPWMRTSCDIDVLVKSADADRAKAALLDMGCTRGEDSTAHDYSFSSSSGVHIELHYTLTQDGVLPQSDSILERVWDTAQPARGSTCRYEMTGELFVFYHLVHMAKHLIRGGCGVRPFVDLWLLEGKMPFDRTLLRQMLETGGLWEFYTAVIALSRVWMENAPHTDTTRKLEEYVLTGGVYGTAANAAKTQAAGGVGKLGSFMELMFLSRESLQIIYPKLKEHPRLMPLYQVRRWLRIFDKTKRRRIRHLTDARNSVSDEESRNTAQLMQSLGLLKTNGRS